MLSFSEKNTDASKRIKKRPNERTNETEYVFMRMCIEEEEKKGRKRKSQNIIN